MVMVEDAELDRAREIARAKPFQSELESSSAAHEEVPSPEEVRPVMRAREQRTAKPPLKLVTPPPPAEPPPPPIVNNRTIAMDRFVSLDEVDLRYLDTPYYITPRDELGVEAFAVIRDALARKAMAGMGRIVLARRERPFLVEAMGNGMRGFTLRYTHEVRDPEPYLASIPQVDLPDDMVEMAELLMEGKSGKFDTRLLEDRYRTTVLEMLREKQTTGPKAVAATPSRQNVIDLMSALKSSLERDRPPAKQHSPKRRAAAAAVHTSPRKRQRPKSG
jgi:DNA end-binding protein Ku